MTKILRKNILSESEKVPKVGVLKVFWKISYLGTK